MAYFIILKAILSEFIVICGYFTLQVFTIITIYRKQKYKRSIINKFRK